MDIDEAGRQYRAAGVDLAPRGAAGFADRGDFTVLHRERAVTHGRTGAIADVGVADQQIVGHREIPPARAADESVNGRVERGFAGAPRGHPSHRDTPRAQVSFAPALWSVKARARGANLQLVRELQRVA